jgi:hypothetical protein
LWRTSNDSGHVQCHANGGPAPDDHSFAFHLPAVVGKGGEPHEGRDLLVTELAELGEVSDERAGNNGPNTRNAPI